MALAPFSPFNPAMLGTWLAPLQWLGPSRQEGIFEGTAEQAFGPITELYESKSGEFYPNCVVTMHGANMSVWARGLETSVQFVYLASGYQSPGIALLTGGINSYFAGYAALLYSLIEKIKGSLDSINCFRIIGHSYGGAATEVLYDLIRSKKFTCPIWGVTAGAPKTGLSGSVSAAGGNYVYRLVANNDPVPFMPPNPAEAGPIPLSILPQIYASWVFQVHPYSAIGLGDDGSTSIVSVGLSNQTYPGNVLVTWVANQTFNLPAQHLLPNYLGKLAYLAGLLEAPTSPTAPPVPIKGEVIQTQDDEMAGGVLPIPVNFPSIAFLASSGAVTTYGELVPNVVIPKAYEMTYTPAAGQFSNWAVLWCGNLVCICETQDQARRVCRYGNHWLRRVQLAGSVSAGGVPAAVGIYLPLALSGVSGFSPTPATAPGVSAT